MIFGIKHHFIGGGIFLSRPGSQAQKKIPGPIGLMLGNIVKNSEKYRAQRVIFMELLNS